MSFKDVFKFAVLPLGIVLAAFRGYNEWMNNKEETTPAYNMYSYATGITGHVEFTTYSNNSVDIKEYPGLGHRFWDSKLYQDLNGDGKVDRIRKNGSEIKLNSIRSLLVREQDFESNKATFLAADAFLQELKEKYN